MSEEKFRRIIDSAQDAVLIIDNQGKVSYWNNSAEKIFGYSAQEALGKKLNTFLVPKRYQAAFKDGFSKFRMTGKGTSTGKTLELEATRKDGTEIPIELSISVIKLKDGWNAAGVVRDINERKRAEEFLLESERKYRILFECATDAVFLLDSEQKHLAVNKKAADMLGYSIEELINLSSKDIVAPAEYEASKDKFENILKGKSFPLYERIFRKKDGTEFPVEINVALMRDKEGKPQFIQSIVRNITERKRVETELKQTSEKLKQSLSGFIEVVASTVELRDPYTAGHQRRVADLASAIAAEMALSKDRIEGIKMAGIIHDLGKISIPAEILSKPGSLSKPEFSLIKGHSKTGYDLLKDVEFPWPIAQIVLQHHERIDGSGYPQGLSGEGFLLEARILGVADVVEAMSSHRPYRPALGIDIALDHISENRGVLYDPEAVDACIKVVSEKKYAFDKQSCYSLNKL